MSANYTTFNRTKNQILNRRYNDRTTREKELRNRICEEDR